MMGHASIVSTQIYAEVTDCKISEDMDRLIAKHKCTNEIMEKEPYKQWCKVRGENELSGIINDNR